MNVPFPEPTGPPAPRAEVLLGYLDYFRALVVTKVQSLSDAQLRVSPLPSGWTVIELVKHLTHVEQRWLMWGSKVSRSRGPGEIHGTIAGTSPTRRTAPSRRCRSNLGRAGTVTHDYKRHGTIDLFAAMNLATGEVLNGCAAEKRVRECLARV